MKKKLLTLVFCVISTTLLLVGCGAKSMKDGTYTSEFEKFDVHGWKGYVSITVSSGKIVDATFDYINEAGEKKSELPDYQSKMSAEVGITATDFSSAYAKDIINKQSEKVDVVTGATYSQGDVKTLAAAAIENAISGNTDTTIIKVSE